MVSSTELHPEIDSPDWRGAGRTPAAGAPPATVPVWLSLVGLGLGAGFSYLAAAGAGALEMLALMTGAAATGGLGVFGLGERLLLARERGGAGHGGAAALYEASPEPIAVLDKTGRIRALNAEARRAAPAEARRAADLLEGVAAPEPLVFRLLSAAFRGEPAEVRIALGAGGEEIAVSVWPVGGGRAAWRWRRTAPRPEAEDDPDAPDEVAPADTELAWIHVGAQGRVIAANAAFERWTGRPAGAVGFHAAFPDAARMFARGGGRVERVVSRTRMISAPGGPRAVALLYAPAGAPGEAIIVATPADRVEVAAPSLSEAAPLAERAAGLLSNERLLGALDALQSWRLFEDAPIGLAVLSPEGRVLRLNAAAERLMGGAAALPGQAPRRAVASGPLGDALADWIGEEDRVEAGQRIDAAAQGYGLEAAPFEVQLGRDDAERRAAQCFLSHVDTPKGRLLICYLIDASERQGLEQRFMQAQKLQAVGQLAGGVAHDFNNLLTVIIGCSEELLQRLTADDPSFADLSAIHQSAHRAASLVRQLLAFSRKQTLRPQLVNLTERLSDLSFMLNRLIGEKVALRQDLLEDLWPVRIDVTQFEQVVTNLVVNARQAMGETGGRIALRTMNETLETERATKHFAMPPGDYVCVSVEDDGCGIAPEVIEKIFEPFYTTKGVGEGTGLGLSTVYGVVKQSGGYIFVDSTVGEGSTFRIYLPRDRSEAAAGIDAGASAGEARRVIERESAAATAAKPRRRRGDRKPEPEPAVSAEPAPPRPASPAATGELSILLVEDETALRAMAARSLRAQGYRVIEVESGEEALEALEDESVTVDLMLSDVVMPNMDGPTLLRRLGDRRPELKTIFMSGYARDAFADTLDSSLSEARPFRFLAKPFRLADLSAAVAEALAEQ